MDENFLQYLWQHRLYANSEFHTTDGDSVEVLYPGDLNVNAGPDFFNAKVRIGETLWVGNVEIHRSGKDWYAHNHHTDPAYNNVILHVIAEKAGKTCAADGQKIPSFVLQTPDDLQNRYLQFLDSQGKLPCQKYLPEFNRFELRFWIEKLISERLETKYLHIRHLLDHTKNDWETALYYLVAEVFGGTVNKPAFLMLAESVPLTMIAKLKKNKHQIEALLFGMSGLLESGGEYYPQSLWNEFQFLRNKFSLTPIPRTVWKFARMRPASSPYIRIAQFADLLYRSSKLFSKSLEAQGASGLNDLFCAQASEYWDTHYSFSKSADPTEKSLSGSFINLIIINAVVPVKFAYGQYSQNFDLQEQALAILEEVPAESNSVVTYWKKQGVECRSAYDSQALIQLDKLYCTPHNCIRCSIGNKLIRENKSIRSYAPDC